MYKLTVETSDKTVSSFLSRGELDFFNYWFQIEASGKEDSVFYLWCTPIKRGNIKSISYEKVDIYWNLEC